MVAPQRDAAMARPREFDQDRVLGRATDVFWRYGYAGASLERIDRATGLQRGSLYNAFGDKHGLFLACLDHYGAKEIGAAVALLSVPGRAQGKVRRLFGAAVAAVRDRGDRRGCLLCNTAVEVAPHDPEVAARVVAHLGALRGAFEGALRADGAMSAAEARRRADLLTADYMGLLVLAKAGFAVAQLRRIAAGACDSVREDTQRGTKRGAQGG